MAITKIWKVVGRLDNTIDYAINGEKTEEKLYVSGINCIPNTAFYEMKNVKKQFFKTNGIQGFHGVQSFSSKEVSAEEAHEIGKKLAEELWGDKFQVIVSTHLNTKNIHNHFVINSVSFIDGKRFCNTKKDYAIMRKTSDKLCSDYGLSALKQEEKYNKYVTSSLYKELMKDSIDYAIANSRNYNEFIKIMEDLDYIITDNNNSLSIRREPYKRNTRIERQFGSKYSKESINKRILETQPKYLYSPKPYLLSQRTFKRYDNERQKTLLFKGSISYLFFYYEKLFGINIENALKPKIMKNTPELIKELKQMDEYSNQAIFLAKNKIETSEQLANFQKLAYEKINPLKSERENLWKKHKRSKTEDEKKVIEDKIIEISKEITPLTEDIKHCQNIQLRMEKIRKFESKQKLEEERKILEKQFEKKGRNRGR